MKVRNFKVTSLLGVLLIISVFAQSAWLSSQAGAASIQHGAASTIEAGPGTPLNIPLTLAGAGATFPKPLILNWTAMYHGTYPNVTITYPGGGSSAGVNQIMNKTIDFGASDAPLNAQQRILLPNILHIPETVGSVTASYNLTAAKITTPLNFTGHVLGEIFLGNIFKWNDPAIQNLNPHVTLPAQNITVVHRSDGSGTTFVWTSFLCLDDPSWCPLKGTTVNPWPTGVGASGNGGVAGFIASHNYTLGYVELNYAIQNKFTFGNIQNPKGNFITANITSTSYAVGNSTSSLPEGNGDWSNVSLLNAPGNQTYPIASFTYLLVYKELNVIPSMDNTAGAKATELVRFLNWIISKGQTYSRGNYYVPLDPQVVAIDQRSINSITFTTNSVRVHRTINLSADSTLGWSLTSIQVYSGDNFSLILTSHDSLSHQFWIEVGKNNGIVDPNETQTESLIFSSPTIPINFTFTPVIYSMNSFPSSGTFTFRDVQNPTGPSGSFTVLQEQTATVFTQPSSSLTTTSRPVIDNSRVSVAGTMLTDVRTGTFSGNITVVAVDKTSGSVQFAKGFRVVLGAPRFSFDVGVPGDLLSVNLQGGNAWGLTRSLDILGTGIIDITDLAIVGAHFGSTLGSPNYQARADLLAAGVIDISDLALIGGAFSNIALL